MQQFYYPSIRHCVQDIIRQDGVRGFYRGVYSLLVTVPFRSSFNITLFSYLKHKQKTSNHFIRGFIPGCYAGCVLSVFVCPVELIKCYMQASNEFKTTSECLRTLYKRHGLKYLMRGLSITIARDSLGFGTFFGVYEFIKGTAHDYNIKLAWWGWIGCGSVSGIIGWFCILPLDCIKTRYQLAIHGESYWAVLKDIIKSHGIRGFWVGGLSTVLRGCIASGVGFSVYELAKTHIPKIIPV